MSTCSITVVGDLFLDDNQQRPQVGHLVVDSAVRKEYVHAVFRRHLLIPDHWQICNNGGSTLRSVSGLGHVGSIPVGGGGFDPGGFDPAEASNTRLCRAKHAQRRVFGALGWIRLTCILTGMHRRSA